MKRLFLLVLLCPIVSFSLEGSGSVDFDSSIVPLLNQNPTLRQFVLCSFDIVSDPVGTRIGDVQSKALGGTRIGPYSMWANWHGATSNQRVVLTVNTQTTFFDKHGKPVNANLSKATRVEERIASVTIEPPEKDQPGIVPGGFKHAVDLSVCSMKPIS
ncbi:hypothetical protein [Paraburkholderia sp. DHOC27]|uniref:hypothetical protein n=1 Tax=Paraburkholderia sp. DHOC27 TaxID=2303330 RepID=UPI0011C0F5EB|nr:hypothetical protein [Paraburkholderia sp. DHOC27]